jgi:hypothetical protein
MARNKTLQKQEIEFTDKFDFSGLPDLYADEEVTGFIGNLLVASNNQLQVAVALTKLVVEKSTDNMNEENIFSLFKRATQVVAESIPLKELLSKLNPA